MNIEKEIISEKWKLFTLTNDSGMSVSILNYGGIITKIMVPDKDDKLENVVLGYKNIADYAENPNFFGALIGRVAGRIQNASFTIDGKTFELDANEGVHHLHGGPGGFHQVVWKDEPFQTDNTVGVKLTHESGDGDGGYPGNMEVTVTYALTNDNQLILDYTGTTDRKTALTMTNHSYFNLSGDLKDTVHNHEVTMESSKFVELDGEFIPTGRLLDVAGTAFDFRYGREISDGIKAGFAQNKIVGNGYDHYFVFDGENRENIVVKEANSGRVLRVETNQPGVVMYTSNGLGNGLELAEGQSEHYLGLCFETQGASASLHHKDFPNIVLGADETYQKITVFSFDVVK